MGENSSTPPESSNTEKSKVIPEEKPKTEITAQLNNDDLEVADYNYFIEELQRIIDDSPPGMQARFARTVTDLKHQKMLLQSATTKNLTVKPSLEAAYNEVAKWMEENEDVPGFKQSRFQNLMKLAHLREKLSQAKKFK